MIVINITTVGVTVLLILSMFVGSGRTNDLLWLLWETTAVALTATVALVVVGEHVLLLSGGVGAAQGLLADSHGELNVCKLVLHCN